MLENILTPFSAEKDFKKNKEKLVRDLFELYNRTVFDNQVKTDTSSIWGTLEHSQSGYRILYLVIQINLLICSFLAVMKIKIAFKSNLFLLLKTVTFILTHALGKSKVKLILIFSR